MNYFHAWGIFFSGVLFSLAWPFGLGSIVILVCVNAFQKDFKIMLFQFIETFMLWGILLIISSKYDQYLWYYLCWICALASLGQMLYQDKKYHKDEVIL